MLLLLGAEHYYHAFPFENRHLVNLAVFLKIVGETEEQDFSLLFEED